MAYVAAIVIGAFALGLAGYGGLAAWPVWSIIPIGALMALNRVNMRSACSERPYSLRELFVRAAFASPVMMIAAAAVYLAAQAVSTSFASSLFVSQGY